MMSYRIISLFNHCKVNDWEKETSDLANYAEYRGKKYFAEVSFRELLTFTRPGGNLSINNSSPPRLGLDMYQCPICLRELPAVERYPSYVCRECVEKAKSKDGRPVRFYNTHLMGSGFAGEYVETGLPYKNDECFIGGRRCRAEEAH
jgi:hypothetical protein